MKITKRQIRNIIREEHGSDWGGGAHEYKRDDDHKTGDVDGHYKDYEGAEGGNFGDVLKSVAVGYVAPKIGSYVTGAVTGATGSVVAGNIAGSAVEAGARGGDLRSALLGGVSSEIASAATKTIKTNLWQGD